jgi:hypothetical protein
MVKTALSHVYINIYNRSADGALGDDLVAIMVVFYDHPRHGLVQLRLVEPVKESKRPPLALVQLNCNCVVAVVRAGAAAAAPCSRPLARPLLALLAAALPALRVPTRSRRRFTAPGFVAPRPSPLIYTKNETRHIIKTLTVYIVMITLKNMYSVPAYARGCAPGSQRDFSCGGVCGRSVTHTHSPKSVP